MKTLLRISALVSLLLMISMAGFSQGTCGMKFSPHNPPAPGDSPWNATYYIWDVTNSQPYETKAFPFPPGVSPTQENDLTFNSISIPTGATYRYLVYVIDGNGHWGYGGSVTFTAAQYNLGGLKLNVNVIYL